MLAEDDLTRSKHVTTLHSTKVFSCVNGVIIPFHLVSFWLGMGMISCSDSWQEQRLFSCVQHPVLGPPSCLFNQPISEAISLVVEWAGHTTDHSSLFGTEVKNAWSYTIISSHISMPWCLNAGITSTLHALWTKLKSTHGIAVFIAQKCLKSWVDQDICVI